MLSPLCFNLFINKLPTVFINDSNSGLFCDPVYVQNIPVNCLMYADDCAIFSRSRVGIQNSINLTVEFFEKLGLPINVKKTKVMIFNVNGLGPKQFSNINFNINGSPLEVCSQYTYLGLIFKPSGSAIAAQAELCTKASKAWFSISHILYQNKKMPVSQALQLVDSVVMPVGLYAAEYLTVMAMPESSFRDKTSVLKAWENFPLEKVNQRACRTLLSLHSRASRLACLGELGRYPMLLKGLLLSVKYDWFLQYKVKKESLVFKVYQEMEELVTSDKDCWLSRVRAVKNLFNINLHSEMSADNVGGKIKNSLNSKFELYWKDSINDPKIGNDNLSHNKLRFYSQLKSCFRQEPYVSQVTNRNQRAWLARIRTSAHCLEIERGRYYNIPIKDRLCVYCCDGEQPDLSVGGM